MSGDARASGDLHFEILGRSPLIIIYCHELPTRTLRPRTALDVGASQNAAPPRAHEKRGDLSGQGSEALLQYIEEQGPDNVAGVGGNPQDKAVGLGGGSSPAVWSESGSTPG